MALSWVHCNNCYLIATAQNTTKHEHFALASCGHIFCSTCLDKCVSGKMCTVCGHSPFIYESVGRHMSEKTKKYFQTPNTLLVNALRKVNSVIKFQQNQYRIMRENVNSMHGQINNVADRCKETAKMCNFLERNANSLVTNIQHHYEVLQRLNNSFADCTQSLKYFGDVSDNADKSGSVDLQPHPSQGNNEQLNKENSFSLGSEPLNSVPSLDGQSLSNFNTPINKLFLHCSDVNRDFALPCHQSIKTPGNLAAVFGGKDRSNAIKSTKHTSSNNPYMHYISQKNTHSLAVVDRNFTCSAATQVEKHGFNLHQLGNKRRPKVPENMQLSQSIFKMGSTRSGIFTVRAHSPSRSPPCKSSRRGDN
ncbi:unnamed protein product [Cercopithifilaria johnstoni]|uniref:RING-type domain-containing protein n=1 Tax=Cercopithifilaria johnstoni TaxID=2874296 RepID=A0A8J2PX34_9BILA|nr:unnamed protein product [Cercopithifilaria johnstoni]